MKAMLHTVGAAAAATIVSFYFSVGFGIGDGFRAVLIEPDFLSVVVIALLFIAGLLAGAARSRQRLVVNLAVVYFGLVIGRLLLFLGPWFAELGNPPSWFILQSLTLGFTVEAGVYYGLVSTPDPVALRILGVLLQVVSVGAGVAMAKLWARHRTTARLA